MQISTHQTTLYSFHLNRDEFANLVLVLKLARCKFDLGSAKQIVDFYDGVDD